MLLRIINVLDKRTGNSIQWKSQLNYITDTNLDEFSVFLRLLLLYTS